MLPSSFSTRASACAMRALQTFTFPVRGESVAATHLKSEGQ